MKSNPFPLVPLGEALAYRKEFIRIDDLQSYKRCRVRLHAQGIALRDIVQGAEIKTKEQQVCGAGEFLVAEIDAKVGGFGVVPDELDGAIVSSHYFLFTINKERLDRQFLDYLSKTPFFRDQVRAQGSTNYAAIRPQHVLNYQIPLPPLAEQRRIVARIEALGAKIEEARQLRLKAAEEAQVLLPAEISRTLQGAGNPMPLCATKSCHIVCGQHLLPEDQAESGVPYMTGPADFGERVATPSRYALNARVKSEPGDVLLTVKGAGVGKANLAPEISCAIGRQLYAVRPLRKSLNQVFLYYALRDGLRHFRESITATTVPGIGREDVQQLPIPFPPLAKQRRIVAYLEGLQTKVDALKKLQAETEKELNALLPSVLDKAFKGEL